MSFVDWRAVAGAVESGVACDAIPARARVWLAVVLMSAEQSDSITPRAIAARCNLPLRTTNNHLKTLRDDGALASNAGQYVNAETRHYHDAENRHSMPKTGTDAGVPKTGIQGVPKTGTIAVPKTGTLSIYKRSLEGYREGGHTPARETTANPEQVDAAPSAPLPHAEGLADVVQAWGSLTDPRGVQWAMLVRPADLSVLKSIHAEHGTALTLEGIAHIQAKPGRGHRAPLVSYVRDRIETIKADRERKPSQARTGRRGACDNLVGTTTPEERRAASYVDPEAAAAFWAKRAEVLAKGKAHVDALKAQGLMD